MRKCNYLLSKPNSQSFKKVLYKVIIFFIIFIKYQSKGDSTLNLRILQGCQELIIVILLQKTLKCYMVT